MPAEENGDLQTSDLCPCGETQTMSHIVESCPLTKLNGGLSRLHSVDEDAVSWLPLLLMTRIREEEGDQYETDKTQFLRYEKSKWNVVTGSSVRNSNVGQWLSIKEEVVARNLMSYNTKVVYDVAVAYILLHNSLTVVCTARAGPAREVAHAIQMLHARMYSLIF